MPRTGHLNRVVVVMLVATEIALSGLLLDVPGSDGAEVVASRQTVYFGLGSVGGVVGGAAALVASVWLVTRR